MGHARGAAALLIAGMALACHATPMQPAGGTTPPASLQFTTAHFVFYYTQADSTIVGSIAASVEEQSRRVTTDLRAGDMAPVQVRFYATHAEMASAVRPFAGEIPSWASGLVTGADRIHMVSPAARGESAERAAVDVLHEFTHCVTLSVNAAAGNNPRWLWETVALYEARQFVDPRTLAYMTAGQVPSLAALNEISNRQIYEVGYVLGEFIVDAGGIDALRALIVQQGDTARVLELETQTFETRWREFLHARYGI